MMQSENVIPFQPAAKGPSTILVVDDEDGVRKLLTAWVTSLGYTVKAAADAATALDVLAQGPIDAAICDILMPGHDGVWLIDQMRRDYPNVGIVIATGVSDMTPAVTLQAGIAGYLVKPFRVDDLRTALDNALAPNSPWLRSVTRGDKAARPLPEL
ncbi:MAG TPA: response regulator [Vicinamibacterales bacterium]|nr:response regulator [Vicinamibacterales bacterium]